MDSSLGVSRFFRKLQSLIPGSHHAPNNHSRSSSPHNHNNNDDQSCSDPPSHNATHGRRKKSTSPQKEASGSTNSKRSKFWEEVKHIRVKPRKLQQHLKNPQNMGCFKDIILACTPSSSKTNQIAPKVSPSPRGPTSPTPVPSGADQFDFELAGMNDNKGEGVSMGTTDSSDFAGNKTMSKNDSYTESPRFQRSTSRNHIVFSTSSGLLKPLQEEHMLECTLYELCFGCVKQIKVSRAIVTSTGSMNKEEELLTVDVKPGWTKGTKITFSGGEDKETGSQSGDIVFVVKEKKHDRLKRLENEEDLEVGIELPLVDAVSGCIMSVPLLDGGQMILFGDDIIEPGFERVIRGQGMPTKKDPSERGDLKIKFQVDFPTSLTDSQRSEISKILNDTDE